MAFVYLAPKTNNADSETEAVGPGTYCEPAIKLKSTCAPFQSSTIKLKAFQSQSLPGPGQYEISRELVSPKLVISTNKQSMIVTVKPVGTRQFKSEDQRFPEAKREVPGPGSWFRLQAERKRQRKHQLLSTIIPTTHKKPSIPARVEHFQSPSNKESMKIDDQVDKKKKILKREKDRSNGKKELFRKRAVTEVGPGSYSLDVKEKPSTRLLPCFASNTVRTYFDSLIFKTNVKEQVQLRKLCKFKSVSPGPGDYDIRKQQNEGERLLASLNNYPFGSAQERFKEGEYVTLPLQSDLHSRQSETYLRLIESHSQSPSKKIPAFLSESDRQLEYLRTQQMENPGPGSYGQLESMHYIKNRETFNKSKREICETKAIDLIGPGSYDTDSKKEMTVPMEQPNFRSGLLRPWNVQKAIDNRFGMYDIAQCDISRKVVNKKLFLEKLKKISVQKPGFEASDVRFPHYIEQAEQEQHDIASRRHYERMLDLKDYAKQQKAIEHCRKQVNESRKLLMETGVERFAGSVHEVPAVGEYSFDSSWDKKTFNIRYKGGHTKTK